MVLRKAMQPRAVGGDLVAIAVGIGVRDRGKPRFLAKFTAQIQDLKTNTKFTTKNLHFYYYHYYYYYFTTTTGTLHLCSDVRGQIDRFSGERTL